MKKVASDMSESDQAQLQDMFAELTGEADADPDILIPKYVELRNTIGAIVKVWNVLLNFEMFTGEFPEFEYAYDACRTFIDQIHKAHRVDAGTKDTARNYAQTSKSEINVLYAGLKDSAEVKSIIIAGAKLNAHKRFLEDKENMDDRFIRQEPGMEFAPVEFCPINFKAVWISDRVNPMVKSFIMTILHKTLTLSMVVYKNTTSPNVDIKKFSEVLVKGIKAVKKQIPYRCDDAFKIISDSVGMLEGNFDTYFKTSVEANNMGLIMESFIVDVSTKQKTSPVVTRQFSKIIQFMKEKSRQSGKNKDPRVQSLFRLLNSKFSAMENSTPGYTPDDSKDPEDPANAADDSNDPEDPAEEAAPQLTPAEEKGGPDELLGGEEFEIVE